MQCHWQARRWETHTKGSSGGRCRCTSTQTVSPLMCFSVNKRFQTLALRCRQALGKEDVTYHECLGWPCPTFTDATMQYQSSGDVMLPQAAETQQCRVLLGCKLSSAP